METKTILAVCAIACTILAFGLCIGALAIPIWWNVSDVLTVGLFKSCVTAFSLNICTETKNVSDNFQATRWLVFGACVLLGITIFLGLLLLCLRNGCLAMTACVFDVVAGLCILTAIIITVKDTESSDANDAFEYGLAFILACISAFFAIIAGISFAFAKPKRSGTKGHVIHPI